jgi:hypothetical protein
VEGQAEISPSSSRLIGEKTALVAVDVALIRKAMKKITDATKPASQNPTVR